MFEQQITHTIQKHILLVLINHEAARFRDLRPPRVDTNLFSYHLKLLVKEGWIEKVPSGYTLSSKGLAYVDRVSMAKLAVRSQPKIISMLVIQNPDGDVLLQKRNKQPYINRWTLPYGKLHIDDATTLQAAEREAYEKLGVRLPNLCHAGDAYIRVWSNETIHSSTIAHIFYCETDQTMPPETSWVAPLKLSRLPLAPAVEQIVARTFFGDEHFFAEFDEALKLPTLQGE